MIVIQHMEAEAALSMSVSHEECGEDSFVANHDLGIDAIDFSICNTMDRFSWLPPGLSVETPPPKA